MTSQIRMTFVFIFLFVIAPVLHAQSAAMEHVFPQFADGVFGDGSTFTSRLLISSIGGFPATCSLTLSGIGPERLTGSTSIEVQPASWATVSTRGQDVIGTGYAVLNCSQPVFASLTYSLQTANGATLGIATIPGAPVASNALIPMVLNGRYRYAIAIANNNDGPLTAAVSFTFNGTSVLRPLQIPARSHYVGFVDELFSVPAEGTGTFQILANASGGSDSFNITALLFDQGTFTNVVPAFVR